ncbi:hypothetical protein CRYUN_Cryun34aG0046400 [Craigia yunnanensis]
MFQIETSRQRGRIDFSSGGPIPFPAFYLVGNIAEAYHQNLLRRKKLEVRRHHLVQRNESWPSIIFYPKTNKVLELQAELAASVGFSVNYVIGRFIVFIRNSELSHLIFANIRPDAFLLVGHPFGKKLFGEHNLIYMFGQDHKELRRQIAPNFTPKALSTYTAFQQFIILKHLKSWERLSSESPAEPISLRLLVRDLNLETSQTVFVGRLAVERLVQTLTDCSAQSKKRMSEGKEPSCLIDFWMQETVREIPESKTAPPHSTDEEIGSYLFDFLFAAQDASTSSLLWAVSLLDSHPDVLRKVREEVSMIWSPESDVLISSDQVREIKYTQAVAREVVRYRAPATLVPHIAMENFPLTESYTIPKGSIVFPSVYESSFQGFTEADRFEPERFSEKRQEDVIFKRNYLAFGAGPHQCVGQRYALNHLVQWCFSLPCSLRCSISRGSEPTAVMKSCTVRPSVLKTGAKFSSLGGAHVIQISLLIDQIPSFFPVSFSGEIWYWLGLLLVELFLTFFRDGTVKRCFPI